MILSPPFQYPSEGSDDRGDRLPASKEFDALALLDAVLQETLRFESVLAASQKGVMPDVPSGTSIDGYGNITGGVSTSSNAYAIHRVAVLPEPENWMPEQWLTQRHKKLEQMSMACVCCKQPRRGRYKTTYNLKSQCLLLTGLWSCSDGTGDRCYHVHQLYYRAHKHGTGGFAHLEAHRQDATYVARLSRCTL